MKSLAKHGLLVALLVSLALTGCSGKKSGDGKGGDGKGGDGKGGDSGKGGAAKIDQSSPEKVAEAFKKAAKDKDWKTMFACVTEDSHKVLLLPPMMIAGFSAFGDKSKKESLDALMKKHGIDPTKKTDPGEDPTTGIKDKPALFGDLVEWVDKNGTKPKGGKPRKSFTEKIAGLELANFKTEGDTATADIMVDGKKKDTADFKKIDGKWYVHMDRKQKRAPSFPKNKAG
jgi:hypothetical protein